jgi:hypothetical protein
MKLIISLIAVTFVLLNVDARSAVKKNSHCKKSGQELQLCSPSDSWRFMGDLGLKPTAEGGASGLLWVHKNRQGNKLNSIMASKDTQTPVMAWENYLRYARHLFEDREFRVLEQTELAKNMTVFKLTDKENKSEFYQAYYVKGDSRWSISCIGPDKEIVAADCNKFFKSALE